MKNLVYSFPGKSETGFKGVFLEKRFERPDLSCSPHLQSQCLGPPLWGVHSFLIGALSFWKCIFFQQMSAPSILNALVGVRPAELFFLSCPSSQIQPAQTSLPGQLSRPLPALPLWPAALVLIVWDGEPAQVSLKLLRYSSIVKIWGSLQNPRNC